jgi:hypothetical protein
MVVVEIAKSGRSECKTCHKFIDKDTVRIGTTVSNDGYINIEWHHTTCFWKTRAKRYYFRQNKKISTVLKFDQFNGLEKLDNSVHDDFRQKILESNLKWGTPEALAKAGIQIPPAETTIEEKPGFRKKAPGKGKGKKRVKDEIDDEGSKEDVGQEVKELEKEVKNEATGVRQSKRRKT